jgi:hypothetical protein
MRCLTRKCIPKPGSQGSERLCRDGLVPRHVVTSVDGPRREIEAAILDEIGGDRVVIIDIVQDELIRRADIQETAGLAKNALGRIPPHWVVMDTMRYVSLEEIQLAQEDVADG